jgi:alpha-D-ribose 1-methylphosphonate 5-phosphate C-P lyase
MLTSYQAGHLSTTYAIPVPFQELLDLSIQPQGTFGEPKVSVREQASQILAPVVMHML